MHSGTWHDCRIGTEGLFETLLDAKKTPPGFAIVGDSAFPNRASMRGKLINVIKDEYLDRIKDPEKKLRAEALNRCVKRVRQASEWGMRALQGPFARLKQQLPVDAERRRLIISTCVRLYNLRVRTVGLNQIASVFVPIWEQSQTTPDHDRVAAYYAKQYRLNKPPEATM